MPHAKPAAAVRGEVVAWTIRILNWGEFQHYKDRDPPWIKLHCRKLLAKRAWRELAPRAAKLLVDLWGLAAAEQKAEQKGSISTPLVDIAWNLRLGEEALLADLQLLASLSFIEVASEAVADCKRTLAADSRLPRSAIPEVEVETEADKRQRQSSVPSEPASAARGELDSEKPAAHGVLMPIIRELFYVPDRKPPAGWDERRDGDIVRVLLKAGRSVDELEQAIRGLRLLVDQPRLWVQDYVVDFAQPGDKLTMRMLHNTKVGKDMPAFAVALQAYWKHDAYNARRKASASAAVRDAMPGLV
jgi:hypothetical protein